MMRKDVRTGFAVGGIFLAIVVVYMMVVPGKKTGDTNLVTNVDDQNGGDQVVNNDQSADPGVTVPPTPAQPETPKKPQKTEPAPPLNGGTSSLVKGTTPPEQNDPFANKGGADWIHILNEGAKVPTMAGNKSADQPKTDDAGSTHDPIGIANQLNDGMNGVDVKTDPVPTTQRSNNSTGQKSHTVAAGETLGKIAAAELGSQRLYPYIEKANPGVDSTKLKIGQKLVIPDISNIKPDAPTKPEHAAAGGGATTPINTKDSYEVASGDTLSRISLKLYGNRGMIQKIYETNKDLIGPDMGKLKLHMRLKLPAAPTAVAEAR